MQARVRTTPWSLLVGSLLGLAGTALGQGTPVTFFQANGTQDSKFGWSVNGIGGDVNGDSVPDFLVGAPGTALGTGAAHVVSGANGATLRQHNGSGAGEAYGSAVDGIGDQNGDGVPEYIVGAPASSSFAGRVEIRDGASGNLIKQFFGLGSTFAWGSSVAGLGDLNSDGRGDYAFNGSVFVGSAWKPALYVMSGATNTILFAQIQAPAGTSQFPSQVSPAGDVNGDGVGDIAVGAVPNALVFSGASGALLRTLASPGSAVDGLGDVNGDGASDVAVGNSSFSTPQGSLFGKVTVCSGATGAALWDFAGDAAGDRFGFAVRAISDVDRDGAADLVVGAPDDIAGFTLGNGYARILSGMDGCRLGDFAGAQLNESFGWAIGNPGDLDNDGADDFVVGGYRYQVIVQVGRVVAYKGQMSGPAVGTKFCYCASPGLGPCQNDATTPGGCKNSLGLDGKLDGYGSTSVSKNDLFLVARDLPPSTPVVFAFGPTQLGGGFGVPAGNGRLCIDNAIVLNPIVFSDSQGVAVIGPCLTNGDPNLAGIQVHLQAWYMDVPVTPCVADFNFTQALTVTFSP